MRINPKTRISIFISLLGLWLVSAVTTSATEIESGSDWIASLDIASDSLISVVIFMDDDQVASEVSRVSAKGHLDRASRINQVSSRLRSYRSDDMDDVESFLKRRSAAEVKRLWIVPSFVATLRPADLAELSKLPGVREIVSDIHIEAVTPYDIAPAPKASTSVSIQQQLIKVQQLWQLGLTGEGRLVCSFDTGVNESHPALAGNWRGNSSDLSAAWMSTIKPDSLPYDKSGHGTHTMGIMVGIDGADTIGVAPGADWITAGVIDQGKSLSATVSDILLAFQWALDPDGNPATTDDVPDVILNSWGVPPGLFSPCNSTFWTAIDNVEAAGIVTIFAAGNEGPDPQTLRNPANRVSGPLNSFSVGSVGNTKVVSNFSSRGPSICGSTSAIKPEVVAPGEGVRSAQKGGGYILMTGTSMAAPYVAGLVALCRQYNPDATVEEIKTALINSAEDLGAAGEDNAYGHGLVDASRLLDFIPAPGQPQFELSGISIADDGIAMPGENSGLNVIISNHADSRESVVGWLTLDDPTSGITVSTDSTVFFFGSGGTAALCSPSFELSIPSNIPHGTVVDLTLQLSDPTGPIYDIMNLSFVVGIIPNGMIADHDAGNIALTVSDFGPLGLGPGSIYNLSGKGLRYNNGNNLLYEAGILVGRNKLQTSSSIRGENGYYESSDFSPIRNLSVAWEGPDQGVHRQATMTDIRADVTIPVTVEQETVDYGASAAGSILMSKYRLINSSLGSLTDLHFGFLTDFDLSASGETIWLDDELSMIVHQGESGPVVGIVALRNISSFQYINNGPSKRGFSKADKYNLLTAESNLTEPQTGDMISFVGAGPFDFNANDSVEVAIAIVVAESISELENLALSAHELYMNPTAAGDGETTLPNQFTLHQNYPNPFNPSTTVAFDLPVASEVTFEVINLLGQQVWRSTMPYLPAGRHEVVWSGTDNSGTSVASGVYFYRVSSDGHSASRKMILLK